MIFIRLFFESFRFAFKALRENLLRTFLSLMGVTVGIFSIIAVLTVVDALHESIQRSFAFLGDKVMYIEKWPYGFGGGEYAWWEFMKRPNPTYDEYEALNGNVQWAEAVSVYDVRGNNTLKYKSNNMTGTDLMGITYNHNQVIEMDIGLGRYFTPQEVSTGRPVVIIGDKVKENLFPNGEVPLGKDIKIKGLKYRIIGVLEKQGENFLPFPSYDEVAIIPFFNLAKLYGSKRRGLSPSIAVKGRADDPNLDNLYYELQGRMRAVRRLKPREKDNFALNKTDAIAEFVSATIGALKIAGWVIGSFALLVGGFGIANIMFVSVKERTNIIGIQKSLGAKNYFILFQFLFEALYLSIIGAIAGLALVSLLSFASTDTFILRLSTFNITVGLVVAMIVGVLAGIIPAFVASRMDPVIAIRS
jgi:putative ABC transport system permease protein